MVERCAPGRHSWSASGRSGLGVRFWPD